MVLVVRRSGMMVVVRVGARLIRGMGEDPPAGFFCGTALARHSAPLEMQMKLVECRRCDPREIERQEDRRPVSHPGQPAGSKSAIAHVIPLDNST